MTAVISDQFSRAPSGVRVLLVGASPTAVTNRACLAAVGYDVQLERAGEAALVVLDQAPCDLIVVDWEFARRGAVSSSAGSVKCPHDCRNI